MSLRRTAAVTVAIAALVLTGCGSNENSTSPDTAPSLAPSAATAYAKQTRISVSWNHNSEADLAGYNVYLAGNSGAVKLNDDVLSENNFAMVAGNDGNYRFRVTAVDRAGNESAPSPIVAVHVALTPTRENTGDDEGVFQGN